MEKRREIPSRIVAPCGVDAQVVNAAHVRHMSARYTLTGVDEADGLHIYFYEIDHKEA